MSEPKHPKSFYEGQLSQHQKSVLERTSVIRWLGLSRLLVFLSLVGFTYFFWGNSQLILVCNAIAIPLFVFLVLRYQKVKYQRALEKALVKTNQTELLVLEGDFHTLPDGKNYANDKHWYSQDIDLFGKGSFYQYLNRTVLKSGSDLLSDVLLSNTIEDIPGKQRAIQELSGQPEWRQHFTAVASLVKTEVNTDTVVAWISAYKAFMPKGIRWVSIGFSVLSIVVWILYFQDLVSGYLVFGVFLLGLMITGRFLPKFNQLSGQVTKAQSTFRQYATLLQLLEKSEFQSALLSEQKKLVHNDEGSSSGVLQRFSKLLDAFDQRNNILIGIVANGFFLRDIYIVKGIENWIEEHRLKVPRWFHAIAFFDAYNSLANYAFNHLNHVYPKIVNEGPTLVSKGLAHPLLPKETAVANDITIGRDEFFIITGANMAGKSTFLRAVGLQLVMANVGLPVCATDVNYRPIKLISSMRTTDSLTDDESYFFSELKRLKHIIDTIADTPHFIILDEILKGTNSTDKAEGSQKFIEKLLGLQATGLIATHDLSLCAVADSYKMVKNHYFDAQIKNDELFFDYTFKDGICQNMNASFLLKKMGIV